MITGWLWPGSLRLRLLGATLVTLALALTGAHGWLSGLFRDHVPEHAGKDAPDPYHSSATGLELALDLIERAVVALGRA